jgi:acetyl-CoA acyltransferase
MDIYAAFARFHMQRFGTTQRQLAVVSSKNQAR